MGHQRWRRRRFSSIALRNSRSARLKKKTVGLLERKIKRESERAARKKKRVTARGDTDFYGA